MLIVISIKPLHKGRLLCCFPMKSAVYMDKLSVACLSPDGQCWDLDGQISLW